MKTITALLTMLVLMTNLSSAELISIPSKDPQVRKLTKQALERLAFSCQGYLGLYGADRSIRNADHFITIRKKGKIYIYEIEGHGIRRSSKEISGVDMLVTTLLQHNAIFNLTEHFHLEPLTP